MHNDAPIEPFAITTLHVRKKIDPGTTALLPDSTLDLMFCGHANRVKKVKSKRIVSFQIPPPALRSANYLV